MIYNKILTPDGVRDLLPPDAAVKRELMNRIEYVFSRFGYQLVETPTFEFIEVFSEEPGSQKQMYKFFDRDGQILALRPDITPSIARISATAYDNNSDPLRFCYFQNAYRYNENYKGKLREFTQAGIELIGSSSIESDSETLAVAINTLFAVGLTDFRIDIGHAKFFEGLVNEAGFDFEKKAVLQNLLVNKDYYGFEEMVKGSDILDSIKELLISLPTLVGQLDVLDKVRCLTNNAIALEAIDRLYEIYDVLCCYDAQDCISFDLGLLTDFNYYTGIIYKGYTYATGFSILDGGRYDNLISRFGASKPSVGFAIKINNLMDVLYRQNIDLSIQKTDTLLVYSDESKKFALACGKVLREQGLIVENSLIGSDLDINKSYALGKGIKGIVYFIDSDNIQLINLKDGSVINTSKQSLLSDLLKG